MITLPADDAGDDSGAPCAARASWWWMTRDRCARVCMSFFRHERFECHEASNGEDALRLLAESPFDLVVLDIYMPKLSGTRNVAAFMCAATAVQQPQDHHGAREEPLPMNCPRCSRSVPTITSPSRSVARNSLPAPRRLFCTRPPKIDRKSFNQQLLRLNAEHEQTLLSRNSAQVERPQRAGRSPWRKSSNRVPRKRRPI